MGIRNGAVLEHKTNYSPGSEPHFDEEWTILTARPVVPLNKLKANDLRVEVLKLVAAFAAAGLFGALVALTSIRLRGETSVAAPQPIAQQANAQENLDTPAETTGVASTDTNSSELAPITDEAQAPVAVAKAPVKVTEATKRKIESPVPQTPREPASLETIASEVLAEPQPADHWEEQRPRRVMNRRRAQLDRQASKTRGIGRIDEIFEGSNPQHPEN